jgi:Zn-dependent M16 (insulinase) family peptidase
MRTIEVSIELPEMLRQYLDQVTSPKKIPKEHIQDWRDNDSQNLTQKEGNDLENFFARLLTEFLIEKKQELLVTTIPNDDMLRAAENTFSLEDYYAYKLVVRFGN